MLAKRCVAGLATLGFVGSVQAQQGRLLHDCTNHENLGGWLNADCESATDSTVWIASSVYLPSFIGNNDGNLQWGEGGNYLSSCRHCSLAVPEAINGTIFLECDCTVSSSSQTRFSQLDLSVHIAPHNGFLLSDIRTVTVPTENKPYPTPSTRAQWSLRMGGQSCTLAPGADGEPPKNCNAGAPVDDPSALNCTEAVSLLTDDFGVPTACSNGAVPLASDHGQVYWSFQAVSVDMKKADWNMTLYDSLDCSGEALAIVAGVDQADTCVPIQRRALSWSMEPMWNADW